jgi:hypothetical protein
MNLLARYFLTSWATVRFSRQSPLTLSLLAKWQAEMWARFLRFSRLSSTCDLGVWMCRCFRASLKNVLPSHIGAASWHMRPKPRCVTASLCVPDAPVVGVCLREETQWVPGSAGSSYGTLSLVQRCARAVCSVRWDPKAFYHVEQTSYQFINCFCWSVCSLTKNLIAYS